MLEVEGLVKTYKTPAGPVCAVDKVDIKLRDTGMVFILGRSGSGKTTLLNLLGGLDRPDEGTIKFDGRDIQNLSEKETDYFRNMDLGLIFQEYNLFEEMNVENNVGIALDISERLTYEERTRRIEAILAYVDMEGMGKRGINELSGGQRQRVAIARALVKDSRIILADEPTGNLDEKTGDMIIRLLQKISKDRLVIIVSHNEEIAQQYGEVIIRIKDGCIDDFIEKEHNALSSYCMTIRDASHQESVSGLSKSELLAQISDYMKNTEKLEITIEHCEDAVSPSPNEVYENKAESMRTPRPLSAKWIMVFSHIYFIKKPLRTVLTVLLFSLSLFLLTVTLYISRYNYIDVITKYIDRYQVKNVLVYEDKTYVDDFYATQEYQLKTGEYFANKLKETVSANQIVPIVRYYSLGDADGSFFEGQMSGKWELNPALITYNSSLMDYEMAEGRLPEHADEIAITDFICSTISSDIDVKPGTEMCLNGVPVKISGIIKTDYQGTNYATMKKLMEYALYVDNLRKTKYEVILIHPDFITKFKDCNSSLELDHNNFVLKANSQENKYSSLTVRGLEEFGKDNSIVMAMGKMPTNKNEILVSQTFYNRYINTSEEMISEDASETVFEELEYMTFDNYLEEYEHYYDGEISLKKYLDSVKIVGVYDEMESEYSRYADVVFMQDVYQEMEDYYFRYLVYSDYMIYLCGDDTRENVERMDTAGLAIDEPSVSLIYQFKNSLVSISFVLAIVLFVVMCITILVIFTFINNSINLYHKTIGVLRAIGATKKDTLHIFTSQVIILTIVSSLLSFLLDYGMKTYVNYKYAQGLSMNPFDIIVSNYLLVLVTVIATVIIATVASFIPIHSLNKEKPINIIRNL